MTCSIRIESPLLCGVGRARRPAGLAAVASSSLNTEATAMADGTSSLLDRLERDRRRVRLDRRVRRIHHRIDGGSGHPTLAAQIKEQLSKAYSATYSSVVLAVLCAAAFFMSLTKRETAPRHQRRAVITKDRPSVIVYNPSAWRLHPVGLGDLQGRTEMIPPPPPPPLPLLPAADVAHATAPSSTVIATPARTPSHAGRAGPGDSSSVGLVG